jgi:glyoxylase-like metal-dependent hydrolase (beta-lactamase superfamily II)
MTTPSRTAITPRRPLLRRAAQALALLLIPVILFVIFLLTVGWPSSFHPTETAALGTPSSAERMEGLLETPGPITVETVLGANWSVDRSGLIDLSDPHAAELEDGLEPIEIYFHALHHSSEGLFVIDTGVERALRSDPEHAAIRGFVASAAHVERMTGGTDTASWLVAHDEPVRGVLLTHLHLDHISGLRDFPVDVPVYTGPGEASARSAMAFATQSTTDRALEGRGPIREWAFEADPSGRFAGLLDVFGDGSLWAIQSPGHTTGSTAFLARTPDGPVLFTGDVCHTAWGWEHDVVPGTFTEDRDANVVSLIALRELVARHPQIDVRLGHQALGGPSGDAR